MDFAILGSEGLTFIFRWVHFLAGITWIGLLYYFNFVQTPFFGETDGNTKSAAIRQLVPRALWWFRWSALVTWLMGFGMLWIFIRNAGGMEFFRTARGILIGTGSTLGTLMLLNVWGIIWRNQKIVIASANAVASGKAADPRAAGAAAAASLASRTNVLFSVPMLFFMAASSHLPINVNPDRSLMGLVLAIAVVLGLLELNAIKGKMGPLAKVAGVIHSGLGLAVVLYGLIEVFTK